MINLNSFLSAHNKGRVNVGKKKKDKRLFIKLGKGGWDIWNNL
jgi:hypothetical protein